MRGLFSKKEKIMTKDFKSVFMKAKSIAETLDSNFTVIIIPLMKDIGKTKVYFK